MLFRLIIVGDEILYGNRQDKHFSFFKSLLSQYGLGLQEVQYLPDSPSILTQALQRSFSDGIPTFVTGGIGSTPDDHTRQAAAKALNLPLQRHPEAAVFIEQVSQTRGDALDSIAHQQRLLMADFPQGAELIPNPYNNIAGFSIQEHYFLPGFPVMAHPMAQWVLEHYYAAEFNRHKMESRCIYLFDIAESRLGPLMREIEQRFPSVRTFSLPSVGKQQAEGRLNGPHIEFGIKADSAAHHDLEDAWLFALSTFSEWNAETMPVTQSHES